jgi:hypothetical protein
MNFLLTRVMTLKKLKTQEILKRYKDKVISFAD